MEIRIAAEDAKIGFVFVKRGLSPEACSTFFLPRIVGASKAAEWLYTGRIWEAKEVHFISASSHLQGENLWIFHLYSSQIPSYGKRSQNSKRNHSKCSRFCIDC